jgi:hypothetical protein
MEQQFAGWLASLDHATVAAVEWVGFPGVILVALLWGCVCYLAGAREERNRPDGAAALEREAARLRHELTDAQELQAVTRRVLHRTVTRERQVAP